VRFSDGLLIFIGARLDS